MRTNSVIFLFIVFLTVFSASCSDPASRNASDSHVTDKKGDIITNEESTSPVSEPIAQSAAFERLNDAHEYIQRNLPEFHSLLITKNGSVIYEKYYSGFHNKSLNNMKSCTKSITSILIGISIDKGFVDNVDSQLSVYYPEHCMDSDVGKIKTRDLLTMTAGFEWEDNGSQMDQWWSGSDLVKGALALPMTRKPGESFNYCSPASHLLSGIIAKTSGISTLDFARNNLFEPLGIEDVKWDADGNGVNYGFGELSLTSRDMAKIGYLYLHGGVWNGNRIVSADWVKESTQEKIKTYSPIGNYGYGWWISEIKGHSCYFAAGWGGQHIFVLPDLDLVVVMTQDWNPKDVSKQHSSPFMLMNQFIVPAAEEK